MHDIDRVRLETQFENEALESGPFEAEQFEFAQAEAPSYGESGEVFGETDEMALASELLEVASEAELDQFLGGLIKRAARAAGGFLSSPAGRAIGGILKGAARRILPTMGSTIGRFFGGSSGAQLGGRAASAAGNLFGLELEGLSAEDQEFEVARRFVRFAGEAVKNAALTPTARDPNAAANAATVAAAQTHAPGLLRPRPPAGAEPPASAQLPTGNSGRWIRRGNKIVLYGI